jgi:RPA family protein
VSDKPKVVLMNSDELFALRPTKKVDRWLFRGELRQSKVTKRNPSHSKDPDTNVGIDVVLASAEQVAATKK